jgi:hypothetical protein
MDAGSIPWTIYLGFWKYRAEHMYSMLPVCLPVYGILTWGIIKGFRYKINEARAKADPSPHPGLP